MHTDIGPLEAELESLIAELIGNNWRYLREPDINGAWGIAIVWAVLKGCSPNAGAVSKYLGVDKPLLQRAFWSLSMNGVFQRHRFDADKAKLEAKDPLTWLYYAGYASEATGNIAAD
jgi:hypothetical protein